VPKNLGKRSTKCRRKVRMTSSQYGLYGLGYTRITMVVTKNSNSASWSKLLKSNLSSDWSLQFGTMKAESRVIANQHVAVNIFTASRHTARHAMEIGFG
jgi:hypothetical protein